MIETLFVGGEWTERTASGKTFDVTNPANGAVLTTLPDAGRDEESGFGREGSPHGIEEYLDVKYISRGYRVGRDNEYTRTSKADRKRWLRCWSPRG